MSADRFWFKLDELVATHPVAIDRPKGSVHPQYGFVYPLDYGYLRGTQSADGDGIDVWMGSLSHSRVTGVICTIDMRKLDAEIKVLLGCTAEEVQQALAVHNVEAQAALLVVRLQGPAHQAQANPDSTID